MERSSYKERDYAFGQQMQELRLAIGLTQTGLAKKLHISRHAVGSWEVGQSYPKLEHLKALIALALQQRVWTYGREIKEIQALWHTTHQKVLLDSAWLQELINQQAPPFIPQQAEHPQATDRNSAHFTDRKPRVDWNDALDTSNVYGRKDELALLYRWVVEERCRIVSVLGMGGIGKSALAVTFMRQVAAHFEVVIWRSLRDAPTCSTLVEECLQVLAPQPPGLISTSLEQRINLLVEQMRTQHTLLVLDNLEILLENRTGHVRADTEGYARLLQQIGETTHQSCLLLTSREKPAELVPLEGSRSPVRSLRLIGLDRDAGAELLAQKDVTLSNRERLVEVYGGNPLALKVVAQTIVELFDGEIGPFLEQGRVIFGDVRKLLSEQFARLSVLEQSLLYWLAILREPVTREELQAFLSKPTPPMDVLEAMNGLYRRSLIERGHRAGSFTLHPVMLEYATTRLITAASHEIEQGQINLFNEYGLCQAQAREYVRKTQEQLLVLPLLSQLHNIYQETTNVEKRLLWLLDHLRSWDQKSQGYGPANLVALLRMLRGNLHGLDLSHLVLRSVSLQGVEMQDARLNGATLQGCIFTEPIDAIMTLAISNTGQYWAAATRQGKVHIWAEAGLSLHRVWSAHISGVTALGFSPDGHTLATGGWDNTVKLWDIASGALLWAGGPTGGIHCMAFAPDGHLLATGGDDRLIRLWDPQSGTNVQTLVGQGGAVHSLIWSPDGKQLASGCSNGNIWLWKTQKARFDSPTHIFTGHINWVTGLAFSPDNTQLASACADNTFKLWDMENFACLHTFSGHTKRVLRVVWSADGRTLASCSFDQTIRLWDTRERRLRVVMNGHIGFHSIAFTSDSRTLLSGGNDGYIQVWDAENGQCLRTIGGHYTASLLDIDWSPDNTRFASGGADGQVTLWKGNSSLSPSVLRGHRWIVQGVAWSPDGQTLASGGYDNSIRLWDTATSVCLQVLYNPDEAETIFLGVAWSPNGRQLACGSFLHGVHVWDMIRRTRLWVSYTESTLIRRVAWSPDGTRIVGGGDNGYIYLWDAISGIQQTRLAGHDGTVRSVAWSPDGMQIASAGGNKEKGELFVWNAHSGERIRTLMEHLGAASAVAWNPNGNMLISGGIDGRLRWWNLQSGQCVQIHEGHQEMVQALKISPDGTKLASCGDDGAILLWNLHTGERLQTLRRDRLYERLNITKIRGLSAVQKASLHSLGACEETSIGGG